MIYKFHFEICPLFNSKSRNIPELLAFIDQYKENLIPNGENLINIFKALQVIRNSPCVAHTDQASNSHPINVDIDDIQKLLPDVKKFTLDVVIAGYKKYLISGSNKLAYPSRI